MDYPEFRRHLGKAGLTVNEFSRLIGVRPSSVSNYSKKSHVPRQYAILAVLLGDAGDRRADFFQLLARFGITVTTDSPNVTSLDAFRAGR